LTAATYLGDIVGIREVLAGQTEEISGIKVVDDYTLQITIDTPKSYFLSKMTYPVSFVVDRNEAELGGEWWREPNGTGPFQLQKWEKENLLVLERNDQYYGEKAKVDEVVFQLWGGVPMNMYEVGEIDAADVNINYVDKVTDPAGNFYQELQIVPELSFSYIGFNHTGPPFDDANLRRAFSMALDKDKLVSLVFREMMERADGILPPGMPGFNEDLKGLEFDIEKARELIASSSYGSVDNLPPITVTTMGWGGLISSSLEAIVHEWRQNLGVEVTVRQLEPEQFLYHLKGEKDELYYMGWVADYPHPQNFLEILFRTGGDNNAGEYSNPGVDDILDRAGVELDYAASLTLYQQAEQMMIEDAACIPLWFPKNYYLVKPYVNGYELTPMGYANLNKVTIERE
jgi:oligopeptide transport system substrate-binding protein